MYVINPKRYKKSGAGFSGENNPQAAGLINASKPSSGYH
jgi:hypothetical protein